jgi:hypothetical protein
MTRRSERILRIDSCAQFEPSRLSRGEPNRVDAADINLLPGDEAHPRADLAHRLDLPVIP